MSTRTIIAVLILLGAFIAINYDKKQAIAPKPESILCTQDAKLCPDGSYVGRTGPDCKFICPDISKPKQEVVVIGNVIGRVVISPACGNIPKDPNLEINCSFRPYKTSILFFNEFSRYTTGSNDEGYYSIDLPLGTYTVQAQGGETFPNCPTENILVSSNRTITKDISCDSGIL